MFPNKTISLVEMKRFPNKREREMDLIHLQVESKIEGIPLIKIKTHSEPWTIELVEFKKRGILSRDVKSLGVFNNDNF